MRAYEAVLVLSPDLEEDGVVAFLDRAREAIEQKDGHVQTVERWGKRRLAYDIHHLKEALYVLMRFEAPEHGGTAELEHLCRISEHVLRSLIVLAVDGPPGHPESTPETGPGQEPASGEQTETA